ncbi:MAG: DUF1549 domain-containing protein [Planctomycetaceae bacterium]|nr:DUF1549 domain-containing protein [Planctomycetaceae bacterium]
MRSLRPIDLLALLVMAWGSAASADETAPLAPGASVDYEKQIRPLLATKCASCHGSLKQQAGLRLDAGELIIKGGDSGLVVKVGKSSESPLIQRVTAADGAARMPPDGEGEHLTPVQVALLKAWIDQGAKYPSDEKIPEDPSQHWSYKVATRPAVPPVKNAAWVRNPIDAFIAAEHDQRGLRPRVEASRAVWLRRVTLDLIGIPPTRDELHAFLADTSPQAYEKVVDALLARPEYGERWGRHWMDVWRYSDWYGSRAINEIRYSQRHIWRWRDWIIESLNEDKPYDRMVTEMLAGDELAPADPNVLRATGFLGRNWYKFDRNVWMFETIEQTSQAFLGLTMKCSRCHDHKVDPITQEDYYRFRAFFEPHDVRTDALTANLATEKDATLGPVLKEGVARVYDKTLDVKTFVFQRGDNRYPDEKRPMTPGAPVALARVMPESAAVAVTPVQLPVEAYYPALSPTRTETLLALADAAVTNAKANVDKAQAAVVTAEATVRDLETRIARGEASPANTVKPALHDDFAKQNKDLWTISSGNWTWENGRLCMRTPGSFATIVSKVDHPRDFQARVRYITLKEGTYRSVGFSFDQNGGGDSQDVYTSVNDNAPTVQAFHRKGGKQEYPQAGIVQTPLKVGEEIVIDVTARGQQLTILVNGVKKLDYVMPVERRAGKFALWAHAGTAEFLEVDVRELSPTLDDLRREAYTAACGVELARHRIAQAEAERSFHVAQIAAERAKHSGQPAETATRLGLEACRAEKQIGVLNARETLLKAEQTLVQIVRTLDGWGSDAALAELPGAPSPALADAEKKLAEARTALAAAEKARDNPDGKYTPLGEQFPQTSTGRRLALAKWIASPDNPRTARVAVNHIWLRHFGQAIVPSVANFGLNGDRPSHPALLDWLACELVEGSEPGKTGAAWRMKHLHRLMVLSATYRQSSSMDAPPADGSSTADKSAASDPTNRFLWRMNFHRIEAEAVRDSVLATAGRLDRTRGGAEIPEGETQTNLRRSVYFRNTPNDKSKFLELFDIANPNECYRRKESVVPQQALALMNSGLALDSARLLARKLSEPTADRDDADARNAFLTAAFESILTRQPTDEERAACVRFLEAGLATPTGPQPTFAAGGGGTTAPSPKPYQRARENLVHVLYSHNDFVTVR